MAIFQPTNILPDLLAGTASGTVFYDPNGTDDPVTVSWSVNGNSPLTAYQIDFYKNDAASTPTQSTGKVSVVPSFCAVSADGTETRFSCTVPSSYFVNAADSYGGYTGKFKITQWWSASDYVVQRSLTVFKVNGISSLSVGFDYPTGIGGVYHFAGTFTPPNPDHFDTSLVWVRWQIFRTGLTDPVQDTGKVWGATSYEWTCQQLLPGYYYAVMSAQSSMGEDLESNKFLFDFGVDGSVVQIDGAITASCDKNLKAVRVEVHYADIIRGICSPDPDFSTYLDSNGYLVLPAGASASWDIPAELYGAKWGFAWSGKQPQNGTVVSVTQSDGTVFDLHMENGVARINPGDVSVALISNMVQKIYFFLTTGTGGDTNNWYLYVGTELSGTYTYYRTLLPSFTQSSPVKVELGENTTTTDCRIIYGQQGPLADAATTTGDASSITNPKIIIPYLADSFLAQRGVAVVEYFGSQLRNGAVYRTTNGGRAEFLAKTMPMSLNTQMVYFDYGVSNDNVYQYFVVHQYGPVSVPTLHQSAQVSPCWWEWTLIEAEKDGTYGTYKPVQSFGFRLNMTSGSDGNGSAPGVFSNFTPYPVVMRDTTNRHSGTLSGLIGHIGSPGFYEDDNATRDAIRALSTTANPIFLRSRRGDLFRVAISGEITTATEDKSPKQQVSASVPWVEVGTVAGSIVSGGFKTIDWWDYFISPEDIVQLTGEMSEEQQEQTRKNLGAVDVTGFPDGVKSALLDCLSHVAWTTDQGQGIYDDLQDALDPAEQG